MPSKPSSSPGGSRMKAVYTSAILNTVLMALQITLGLLAHSDGLLADGIHTLSDLAADAVVLAILYATAANSKKQKSHEPLASLLIAAVLITTAVETLWHSVMQTSTLSGSTAMQATALAIAILVTIAKETLFRYMRAEGNRTHSPILLASAWHARVDAVSALVATLGIAGGMAGIPMLDHVAGAAIGLMILRMGYTTGWTALKELSSRPLSETAGH